MTKKRPAASSLRRKLIKSAPKPTPSRAWWSKLSTEELKEIRELCREREIDGSEINILYPSKVSLARFFMKEFAPNIASRTVIDFIESCLRE